MKQIDLFVMQILPFCLVKRFVYLIFIFICVTHLTVQIITRSYCCSSQKARIYTAINESNTGFLQKTFQNKSQVTISLQTQQKHCNNQRLCYVFDMMRGGLGRFLMLIYLEGTIESRSFSVGRRNLFAPKSKPQNKQRFNWSADPPANKLTP